MSEHIFDTLAEKVLQQNAFFFLMLKLILGNQLDYLLLVRGHGLEDESQTYLLIFIFSCEKAGHILHFIVEVLESVHLNAHYVKLV